MPSFWVKTSFDFGGKFLGRGKERRYELFPENSYRQTDMPGRAFPGEIESLFQRFKGHEDALFVIRHGMKFHADRYAYGNGFMLGVRVMEREKIGRSDVVQPEEWNRPGRQTPRR